MYAFGIGGRRGLQATGNAVAIRHITQIHKTPTLVTNPMHRDLDAFRSSPTKLPDAGVLVHVGDDLKFCLVFPIQIICAFLHLTNYVPFLQFPGVWPKVFRRALPVYFPIV